MSYAILVITAVVVGAAAGVAAYRWLGRRRPRYPEAVERALAGHVRDGIVMIDERSRIVFATPALQRILGYAPDELIGRELTMLMPARLRARHLASLGDYLRTGRKRVAWDGVELPGLHRGGHEVPLEISLEEVAEGGRRFVTGVIRDITVRKQVEAALVRERAHLDELFESAPEAVALVDTESRVLRANRCFTALFGYMPEELRGQSLDELLAPDHLRAEAAMLTKQAAQGEYVAAETVRRRKDGSLVDVSILGAPIKVAGERVAVYAIYRDITQRRRHESELEGSRRELQELARRLENVREDERRRIAREIHDELGQALTALKLDLVWLQERLPAGTETLARFADGIQGLMDRTIQQVRRIAAELRPGVLDDLGLAPAVEWYAQEFEKHSRIATEITVRGADTGLDGERATALFRILQEALTNVARHAGARTVQIALELRPAEAVLEVRDDGRGIRDDKVGGSGSMGLLGMRERAAALGGVVTVERLGERGTAVRARLPLSGGTRGGGPA